MDTPYDGEVPLNFESTVADIARADKEPGDSSIQNDAIIKCIKYIQKNCQSRHFFCDRYMYPIATHYLIVFSFPGKKNDDISKINQTLVEYLESCENCVHYYNKSMASLREKFVVERETPITNIENFLNLIYEWEAIRVDQTLEILLNDLEDQSHIPSQKQINALAECLMGPSILRNHTNVRLKFEKVISCNAKFLSSFLPKWLYPGLIYLFFDGTAKEKEWVEKSINHLQKSLFKFNDKSLDETIIDEFSKYLYKIQNSKYFTDSLCITFWTFVDIFVQFLDESAFTKINEPKDIKIMSKHLDVTFFSFVRVLLNNITAPQDKPLRALLGAFSSVLKVLGEKFWTHASPYIFGAFLDPILLNPNFTKLLLSDTINDEEGCIKSLNWTGYFIDTLKGSQKQAGAVRLSVFLVAMAEKRLAINANNVEGKMHVFISKTTTSLLLKCFDLDEDKIDFHEATFSVNILKKSDARAAVDNNSAYFVKLATDNNQPDQEQAIKLITRCISYDIISLAHNSSVLKNGKVPSSFNAFPLLWQSLLKLSIYSYPTLIRKLVKSLKNTSSIIQFTSKKNDKSNKEEIDAKNQHNKNVVLIFELLGNVLDKIGLAEPDVLKQIFADSNTLVSYWSCVFSPYVNQASLNILYQVFDAAGRFEAIDGVLRLNLRSTLGAINQTLSTLTKLSVFEPCPKAIRIMMDIISALTNPSGGILTSKLVDETKMQIQMLWKSSWNFLIMVYQKTLVWASQYRLDDLIEFTRDTLDLSHSLLDSFRIILNVLDGPTDEKAHSLFNVFMDAFHYVIVWLRLGDTSLLSSCVTLVFKGFALAKDLEFSIDKEFITTFVKFGARAKKFNNKLDDQQRMDILAKAGEFDERLVEEIVADARRSRGSLKPSELLSPTPSIEQAASFKYQTHQKQVKQQTLSRFGVVTKEAPVAPAPENKGYKSANLEAIRQELKSNRVPSSKAPLIAPAAPRPAGFNKTSTPTAVGRSLNATRRKKNDSDSSEDEAEDDAVDISDLFVDKKKARAKVTEIDLNGKPIIRLAQSKVINQQRKDEENMRMRLNVNLKPLYTTILKWNYNSTNQYPGTDRDLYQPTKSVYEDCRDYIKVTEPLLMLECWQGIQSAKHTHEEEPFEILVGSRTSCDGFFDVYASVRKKDLSDRKIGDSDLLVLGHSDSEYMSGSDVSRYLKSPNSHTCLAKVREIKSANIDYSDITLRVFPQGSMMGVLTPKSVVMGMRVMQMVTIEREYSSLKGLPYYDLSDAIFKGEPTKTLNISDEETNKMLALHQVNKSQARAIIGTSNSEGFSLIQGPPGTGKTKTILGIVGYSLSQSAKSNAISNPVTTNGVEGSILDEKGPKVLICAPSNAAVDELVLRLRDGVKRPKGELFTPNVVRLGRSDAINAAVRDLTLEELLDKQLQAQHSETVVDPTIRTEHTKCIALRDKIRNELNVPNLKEAKIVDLESQLRDVNKKRNELAKKLDEQRENVSIAYRSREIERRQLQAKILSNAQVICSTLSGSAHDFLASLSIKFDQVIIDEACQCVELSAIIPLRYGCKKCIMVGDPNQLPPTVLSQAAASYNYEQSLFVRMQKNHPNSVYLLDVQYRMHPSISMFPSTTFYESRLKDGDSMAIKNERPWHNEYPLTPYRFFDIVGKHQKDNLSRSLFNPLEARVALELVERLMAILPNDKFKGRIGIISPYKEQVRTLKDVFRRKYGHTILDEIDFNTVDGFQGQEKEVIIMSCVRASETGNVGFLSDVRRMNVALTRARTSLWILGNAQSLKRNKVWSSLLADAASRDCITQAYPGFLSKISHPITNNATKSHLMSHDPSSKRKVYFNESNEAKRSKVFALPHEGPKPSEKNDNTPSVLPPPESAKPIKKNHALPVIHPPFKSTKPLKKSSTLPDVLPPPPTPPISLGGGGNHDQKPKPPSSTTEHQNQKPTYAGNAKYDSTNQHNRGKVIIPDGPSATKDQYKSNQNQYVGKSGYYNKNEKFRQYQPSETTNRGNFSGQGQSQSYSMGQGQDEATGVPYPSNSGTIRKPQNKRPNIFINKRKKQRPPPR